MLPLFTAAAAAAATLALIAAPLAAAHEYSSNTTACSRHYTVQDGDTCDIIGQKTITSTYQILAFNLPKAGKDCYTLENGADLCLGRYGNDCQLVHRARNSDTCYSIAAKYSISLSMLQDNNPSLNCDQVYDGLNLCVAPGVMRPPPVEELQAAIQDQKTSDGSSTASSRRRRSQPEDEDEVEDGEQLLDAEERQRLRDLREQQQQRRAAASQAQAQQQQQHVAGRFQGIHSPSVRHQAMA